MAIVVSFFSGIVDERDHVRLDRDYRGLLADERRFGTLTIEPFGVAVLRTF